METLYIGRRECVATRAESVDDNVLTVSSFTPLPRLSISGSNANALVSWPVAGSDGFVLMQSTNLSLGNRTVVSPVMTLDGTNQVSISPLLKAQFFRGYHP